MTHPLTPREKDLAIETDPKLSSTGVDDSALASGSGDHAELARLAEWRDRLRADPGRAAHFGSPYADKPMQNGRTYWNIDLADDITTLIAEVAALREDLNRKHEACQIAQDQAMENGSRAREAERKLAEAVEAMEEIAAIEPKPFEGGLDMESIRACEECRRYEGHPVQHGICNTHRRPIWDREKHEGHEEKALGYRAKSIARTFLSKEAERG